MRRSLITLIAAFLMTATQRADVPQDSPNILFIAVDDLRVELNCYGQSHVQSPNIDRLASRAITFDRAYCQQSVCHPSRASVMTGMRPHSTGIEHLWTALRTAVPDAITLPQHFRKHGYRYTEWWNHETETLLAREFYDHFADSAETINQVENTSFADAVASLEQILRQGHKLPAAPN